ncbi:MAG: amidohydrolase, partial [Rhodospirillales bacterium]|nr:amidohydrolase [Rhodospirillales bacterium]
ELMSVGVNYLREHVPSSARLHYAYLDAGGIAPNVVQAKATVRHLVRADDLRTLAGLVKRVRKIGEGAALMTETKLTVSVVSAVSNLLGNTPLEQAMHEAMLRLGPPDFDAADRAYAEQIRATLSPEDIAAPWKQLGLKDTGTALADFIVPLGAVGDLSLGSTDVGDVSWKVPTVQADGATCAVGTPFHSWQLTAQGKSPAAHKGMLHVAKVMASTAIAALTDATLITRAKAEHRERTGGTDYACPMPPEVKPPLKPRRSV